jgi:hypothetical protein
VRWQLVALWPADRRVLLQLTRAQPLEQRAADGHTRHTAQRCVRPNAARDGWAADEQPCDRGGA